MYTSRSSYISRIFFISQKVRLSHIQCVIWQSYQRGAAYTELKLTESEKQDNKTLQDTIFHIFFIFSRRIVGSVFSQIDLLQYGDRLVINEFIFIRKI